jgi:hypothetical protein
MFSIADIQAHVDRLDDEFAAVRRRAETRRASEFVERIEPGLGTVTVFGTGELKTVELSTYRVTHYRGAALGSAICEAIRRAEQRARDSGTK